MKLRALLHLSPLALCTAVLGACLGPFEPDVGEPIAGLCKNEDSDPDVDISFKEDVLPLLQNACGCHDPKKGGSAIDLVGFSVENYAKIRRGGVNTGGSIVVDHEPCSSVLLQKLGEAPPFGSRMPTFGPYLTREEMAILHDWIAEGARDN
jgi:hypothetical protein